MAENDNNNNNNSSDKPFDPMEPWRGVRDAYLDAWSKAMIEMVNNESYAQATGALLNTSLAVSAPFREVLEKTMLKTLEQLSMPSRADIVSIAERITNIEMRLDDLDAKLDRIVQSAKGSRTSSARSARKEPAPEKAPILSEEAQKGTN